MSNYFKGVEKIAYEGRESTNPLSFKWYDKNKVIGGKTMGEHFRFAVAYWHTFKGTGSDMFGSGTYRRPWNTASDPLGLAELTLDACFEFCQKLGLDFYCFHDRDVAPEGKNFIESCDNLAKVAQMAKTRQEQTGIKLLWGTANLFSHPRYMHGAFTNPDAQVAAYAAAQVKNAMDATKLLGGQGYVFWGGREGYETLLNTDLKREQAQLAAGLHMAVDYAKKIGFDGQFMIEPKPCEPTKHQYDHDSATVISFLRQHGLSDYFKLNIEANHATLAGHSFHHELAVASAAGMLGSVDANRGDTLLGWDTDQFPTDIYDTTYAMLIILQQDGGLGKGGLNFDAKPRRGSCEETDLFHAHIGAMDAFARGLLIAQKILDDGKLTGFVADRYASWNDGIGKDFLGGKATLESLDAFTRKHDEPTLRSGRQEMLENLVNTYI